VVESNPEFALKIEQDIEARLKTIDAIREQHQPGVTVSHQQQDTVINLKDLLRKKQRDKSLG